MEAIRSVAEVQGLNTENDIGGSNGNNKNSKEEVIIDYLALEEEYRKLLSKAYKFKKEVLQMAEDISDPVNKSLFELRYIRLKSWREIGSILNYSERQIRNRNKNILNKIRPINF